MDMLPKPDVMSHKPLRVFGWNSRGPQNCTGQRVCGKSEDDESLRKSTSALSLALSECSDTDSSMLSSEDTFRKSYKEVLTSHPEVDERSENACSDPVAIYWPRGKNKHPRRPR